MGPLRYLLFAAIGLVVASAVFLGVSWLFTTNYEAGTRFFERWIVRITCEAFELNGVVRDPGGLPVAFAVVEVSYLDERLTTRSNSDGQFVVTADEAICNRRPPQNVSLVVMADNFRPRRAAVPFEAGSVEVTLDRRELSF
jgi:hypothetical protein